MIWIVFALLTGVTVLAVLWPLLHAPRAVLRKDADVAFYEAQIAEIERDAERGLISPEDAATAKVEAGRRLIAAGAAVDVSNSSARKEPKLGRRRLLAAAFAIVLVPAVGWGLYGFVGHPNMPDDPLLARLNAKPGDMDIATAVAKIEAHLRQEPNDGKAYEVLAPIYLNLGRADDAVNAYANALRLLGDTPERRTAYGGALVFAAGGRVTPEARAAFNAALSKDPTVPQARFFLGVAAEQDGDKAGAVDIWTKLLANTPADAPWADFVRQKIVADGGNTASLPQLSSGALPPQSGAAPEARVAAPPAPEAASVAALPPEEREKMIRSMVDGLAQRLHQDGHDVDGWLRLVRAYTVLQEPDKARAALTDARKSLGSDSAALARLDQLAQELGLAG
jgi:cytochrome c-type biogenesis protein CcmH